MLMDIHVHGPLCIYSQYQYYQIGFALSLLVQESQEKIYHFTCSKSEFCSKIKIT